MFLIPYIYKKDGGEYFIHKFYIFLVQGKLFLEMDRDEIDEFCKENGFFFTNTFIEDNKCYLRIDPEKTDIQSFYLYTECSDLECWRRFIMIGNKEEDFLHVNNTNPEFILPILYKVLELL